MTVLETFPMVPDRTPDFPAVRRDVRAVPLRGGRWRVTRERGEVLGYIDLIDGSAPRYRGSRLRASTLHLVDLGEFTDPADALEVVTGG